MQSKLNYKMFSYTSNNHFASKDIFRFARLEIYSFVAEFPNVKVNNIAPQQNMNSCVWYS